jgi:hypothetical protein
MIEVSMTEIALLVWAGLATAVAFHYRAQEGAAKDFIRAMCKHKDLRDRVVADYEEHMRGEA